MRRPIPDWLDGLFEGLDDLPAARQLIAATVAAELAGQLYAGGVRHFHFYTLNRAELTYAICHLLGARPTRMTAAQTFRAEAAKRILIKDGPYGTAIQAERLQAPDYCGGLDLLKDQKGNNDLLNLTRPEIVRSICEQFADAGAEVLATNTFNANAISQADYGAEALVRRSMKKQRESPAKSPTRWREAVGRGRARADEQDPVAFAQRQRPRLSRDHFDQVKAVYREQVDALIDGGVDFILVETIFDTLNAKAAIMATLEAEQALGRELPLMISMTLTDLCGRNLSGHTVEAFWASVRHARPLTIGLNCSFGAASFARTSPRCRRSPTRW